MSNINFIYENICKEKVLEEISKHFNKPFKVTDADGSIPETGVFLGSIAMNRWIQENRPKVKTWNTEGEYSCSNYYPIIGDLLFNERYLFVPFKELGRRKWDIYSWLGKEAVVFIRPDSGDKDTPAELVDIQDIDKHVNNYDYEGLAVVSSPKDSIGEWRFVVKGKDIRAVSSYKYQGLLTKVPSAPPGAHELVKNVLNIGWAPDEIFCVDVVQDMAGDFWVMEITSFSSAGLYACDPQKIADLIKESADAKADDDLAEIEKLLG